MTEQRPQRGATRAAKRSTAAVADHELTRDAAVVDREARGAAVVDRGARSAAVIDLRQLAAAAAHEIRNPLNTMAIHCELLESRLRRLPHGESADSRESREVRESLLRSINSLCKEVERIDHTLARFLTHAGPRDLERQSVDADLWLAQLVVEARAAAATAGVAVQLVHGKLGRWNVDGESLGRAVQAVLENAVLATPRGGAVLVNAQVDDGHGEICIRDQGPGIPAEALALVCQLGYSTRPGHPGLGLAIAKQVVKSQHGGELRLSSAPGAGTSVTLSVPLDDEDQDDNGDSASHDDEDDDLGA